MPPWTRLAAYRKTTLVEQTQLLTSISEKWRANPRTGELTRLIHGARVTIVPTSFSTTEDETHVPCPVRIKIYDNETQTMHDAGEYPNLLEAMAAVDRNA